MDNDNNALTNRMSSTKTVVHSLESQLAKVNKTARKHQDEIFEKESEISKVKLLLEESEKSKIDLQKKLEERLATCGEFEEHNGNLQDDIGKFWSFLASNWKKNYNLNKFDLSRLKTK